MNDECQKSVAQRLGHGVIILLWVGGAAMAWQGSLVIAIQVFLRIQRARRWSATPGWAWDTLLFDGGTILVVITILLLARRGKLPGTRKAGGQSSGFPVTANTENRGPGRGAARQP